MHENNTRRASKRGQGMTEYIILVGLIAILVIAGVNKYQFSVNEAIQGSVKAWEEADGTRPTGPSPGGPPPTGATRIGTDGPSNTGRDVFRNAAGESVYSNGDFATVNPN